MPLNHMPRNRSIPTLAAALIACAVFGLSACSSVLGPPARSGVSGDSPRGGGYEYGAKGASNGNNWEPVNGDAADLRRR